MGVLPSDKEILKCVHFSVNISNSLNSSIKDIIFAPISCGMVLISNQEILLFLLIHSKLYEFVSG